jgi:hypothetical protein
MTWFEDDSHTIPEELLKLSHEELKKKVAECDEVLRKERDDRHNANPSVHKSIPATN